MRFRQKRNIHFMATPPLEIAEFNEFIYSASSHITVCILTR